MCSVEPLRSKAVLHVMDGMRMVWHGGPLTQNQDFIYQAGLMMVGTDPVAMDTIELEKIEAKRCKEVRPQFGRVNRRASPRMGLSFTKTPRRISFIDNHITLRQLENWDWEFPT
jgi:uncharacterized protein (DUF362 family)